MLQDGLQGKPSDLRKEPFNAEMLAFFTGA